MSSNLFDVVCDPGLFLTSVLVNVTLSGALSGISTSTSVCLSSLSTCPVVDPFLSIVTDPSNSCAVWKEHQPGSASASVGSRACLEHLSYPYLCPSLESESENAIACPFCPFYHGLLDRLGRVLRTKVQQQHLQQKVAVATVSVNAVQKA